jgi:hypothetical protein
MNAFVQPIGLESEVTGNSRRRLSHLSRRCEDGIHVNGRAPCVVGQGHGSATDDEDLATNAFRSQFLIKDTQSPEEVSSIE